MVRCLFMVGSLFVLLELVHGDTQTCCSLSAIQARLARPAAYTVVDGEIHYPIKTSTNGLDFIDAIAGGRFTVSSGPTQAICELKPLPGPRSGEIPVRPSTAFYDGDYCGLIRGKDGVGVSWNQKEGLQKDLGDPFLADYAFIMYRANWLRMLGLPIPPSADSLFTGVSFTGEYIQDNALIRINGQTLTNASGLITNLQLIRSGPITIVTNLISYNYGPTGANSSYAVSVSNHQFRGPGITNLGAHDLIWMYSISNLTLRSLSVVELEATMIKAKHGVESQQHQFKLANGRLLALNTNGIWLPAPGLRHHAETSYLSPTSARFALTTFSGLVLLSLFLAWLWLEHTKLNLFHKQSQ